MDRELEELQRRAARLGMMVLPKEELSYLYKVYCYRYYRNTPKIFATYKSAQKHAKELVIKTFSYMHDNDMSQNLRIQYVKYDDLYKKEIWNVYSLHHLSNGEISLWKERIEI